MSIQTGPAPVPRGLPRLSIAVLEDDDSLREQILMPELEDHGFRPMGASTAADLYRMLLQGPVELALLDIGLPDEDGLSVAARLRQAFPEIGIVMLTSNDDRASHLQALTNGADAFLPKPLDPDILMATLHRLARRMRLPSASPQAAVARPRAAGWMLEADGWCLVSPQGTLCALTAPERCVMRELDAHRHEPVTREALIGALVSAEEAIEFDPRRLDMLVHRLRRKVSLAVGDGLPFPLIAVRGTGYVFAG